MSAGCAVLPETANSSPGGEEGGPRPPDRPFPGFPASFLLCPPKWAQLRNTYLYTLAFYLAGTNFIFLEPVPYSFIFTCCLEFALISTLFRRAFICMTNLTPAELISSLGLVVYVHSKAVGASRCKREGMGSQGQTGIKLKQPVLSTERAQTKRISLN